MFAISVKVKLKGVNEASKGPTREHVSLKGPSTVKYWKALVKGFRVVRNVGKVSFRGPPKVKIVERSC